MKTYRSLKAPVFGLGMLSLMALGVIFHHAALPYLLETTITNRLSAIHTWEQSQVSFTKQQIYFSGVHLSAQNERNETVFSDALTIDWQLGLDPLIDIKKIQIVGLTVSLSETHIKATPMTSEQDTIHWASLTQNILSTSLNSMNTPALIECEGCTVKWANTRPSAQNNSKDAMEEYLIAYEGDFSAELFFTEKKPLPAPSHTNNYPAKEKRQPFEQQAPLTLAWHSVGKLQVGDDTNSTELSMSGALIGPEDQAGTWTFHANTTEAKHPIDVNIHPNLRMTLKPTFNFTANLNQLANDETLSLTSWKLASDLEYGQLVANPSNRAHSSTTAITQWLKGDLEINHQYQLGNHPKSSERTNPLKAKLTLIEPTLGIETIRYTPTPKVFRYNSLAESLNLTFNHGREGWTANDANIFGLLTHSKASGSQAFEVHVDKVYMDKVSLRKRHALNVHLDAQAHHHKLHSLDAEKIQILGTTLFTENPNVIEKEWGSWINKDILPGLSISADNFSALNETKILLQKGNLVETEIFITPFHFSNNNLTQAISVSARSKNLNIMHQSNQIYLSPITPIKNIPKNISLAVQKDRCSLGSKVSLAMTNKPFLNGINLPSYLTDIMTSNMENQVKHFLETRTCNIYQPHQVLNIISNEIPKMVAEKSASKLSVFNPKKNHAKVVNRFPPNEILKEVQLGQFNFSPLSNRLPPKQQAHLAQVIAHLKEIVSISDKIQLRLEATANKKDLKQWETAQNKPSSKNESETLIFLARQRGLGLKKMLTDAGIPAEQIYLTRPKYINSEDEDSNLKIFL